MMFPGCPSCSSAADGYNGFAIHLENHDVAMTTVSRYPIEELTAFKKRMGWTVPYVSSLGSDFNFDFGFAYTDEEMASGPEHNLHSNWDHSDTPASRARRRRDDPQPERHAAARRRRHERIRVGGRHRVPHLLGLAQARAAPHGPGRKRAAEAGEGEDRERRLRHRFAPGLQEHHPVAVGRSDHACRHDDRLVAMSSHPATPPPRRPWRASTASGSGRPCP